MEEDITKITLLELLSEGDITIDKKFVLINSSMYTGEAFAYILNKCDKVGAVVFVSDKRKIYAQGEFFGGDLFEDTVRSVTKFDVQNFGETQGLIEILKPEETLTLNGLDGVNLSIVQTEDTKTINIGYDLVGRLNKEEVSFEKDSKYHLDVVDGKISIVKYTPASLYIEPFEMLERDGGDKFLIFDIQVGGTDPLTRFEITSNPETRIIQVPNTNKVQAVIPNNINVDFHIEYSDGTTDGTYDMSQLWGCACVYGTTVPSSENFTTLDRFLIPDNVVNTIVTIDQGNDKYGYFACPANITPVFVDESTNLTGGWEKTGSLWIYAANIKYSVYKTENIGLGNVTWIIKSK